MALAWAVAEDVDHGDTERAPSNLRPVGFGEATGETAPARLGEAAGTRSLSVLVADDEASLRSTLSTILESAGHRVVEAEDGEIALRLLHEQAFDLLVLDLFMPKLDGMEVLRSIRVPPPIVIVYSAFAYFSLRAVREELGSSVFRFVQKPAPPLELIAAVNDAAAELDR
jgi:CheY-like chemotaxis protein